MRVQLSSQEPSLLWREIGRLGAIAGAHYARGLFPQREVGRLFPRDYANYVLGPRLPHNSGSMAARRGILPMAARFYDNWFYNEHLRALIPWEYPDATMVLSATHSPVGGAVRLASVYSRLRAFGRRSP